MDNQYILMYTIMIFIALVIAVSFYIHLFIAFKRLKKENKHLQDNQTLDAVKRMIGLESRDWLTDYEQHGLTKCKCITCTHTFFGGKHRVICKKCAIEKKDSR